MAGSKRARGGARGKRVPNPVTPRPVRSGARSEANRAEARRRFAEREREAKRRRRRRRGLLSLGVVAGIVLFVVVDVFVHRLNGEQKALLARAPAAAAAAGCGPVRAVEPYRPASLDRAHIGGSD